MTRLSNVFDIERDEAGAIKSFADKGSKGVA
jgi:hypothetical protein